MDSYDKCPHCKEKTLSARSITVMICLKCGKIKDSEKVLELLEKIGIDIEAINKVQASIVKIEL